MCGTTPRIRMWTELAALALDAVTAIASAASTRILVKRAPKLLIPRTECPKKT
jgi:hypothetical protein